MSLGELIKLLEKEEQSKVIPFGFTRPHSYRGDYSKLAFEPELNITVREMLMAAKSALGATYDGYKGGEFQMNEYTDVHLAYYGECGEKIGKTLLMFMLGKRPTLIPCKDGYGGYEISEEA